MGGQQQAWLPHIMATMQVASMATIRHGYNASSFQCKKNQPNTQHCTTTLQTAAAYKSRPIRDVHPMTCLPQMPASLGGRLRLSLGDLLQQLLVQGAATSLAPTRDGYSYKLANPPTPAQFAQKANLLLALLCIMLQLLVWGKSCCAADMCAVAAAAAASSTPNSC